MSATSLFLVMLLVLTSCKSREFSNRLKGQETTEASTKEIYLALSKKLTKGTPLPTNIRSLSHNPSFGFEVEGHSPRVLKTYGLNGRGIASFSEEILIPELQRVYLTWCLEEIRKLGPQLKPVWEDSKLPVWDLSRSSIFKTSAEKTPSQLMEIFKNELNPPQGILFDYLPPELQKLMFNRYPIKLYMPKNLRRLRKQADEVFSWSDEKVFPHFDESSLDLYEHYKATNELDNELPQLINQVKDNLRQKFLQNLAISIPKHLLVLNEQGQKQNLNINLTAEKQLWEVISNKFDTYIEMEAGLFDFLKTLLIKDSQKKRVQPASIHATVVVPKSAFGAETKMENLVQYYKFLEAFAIVFTVKGGRLISYNSMVSPLGLSALNDARRSSQLRIGHWNAVRVQEGRFKESLNYEHVRLELRLSAESQAFRRSAFLSFLTNLYAQTWKNFVWNDATLIPGGTISERLIPLGPQSLIEFLSRLNALIGSGGDSFHFAYLSKHIPLWNWGKLFRLSPTESACLSQAKVAYFEELQAAPELNAKSIAEASAHWVERCDVVTIAFRHLFPGSLNREQSEG